MRTDGWGRWVAVAVLWPGLALAGGPDHEGGADASFGAAGQARIDFAGAGGSTRDDGYLVVPDAGGYWVLGMVSTGGTFDSYRIALARLLPDGTPDPAFNGTGQLVTPVQGVPFGDAFVDSMGRLVVQVRAPGSGADGVARFLASGALDTSFAGDGVWETGGSGSENDMVWDIAPAAGDGVWVSKQEAAPFANSELLRLTSAGVPDPLFPAFGRDAFDGRLPAWQAGVEVDAQGRVWWAPLGAAADVVQLVARLTPSGAVDTGFGGGDGYLEVPEDACLASGTSWSRLAVLPADTAVVRFETGSGAGALAVRADGSSGPVRCEGLDGPLAITPGITARDRSSLLGASWACTGSGCGLALRRFLVTTQLEVVDDPAFAVQPIVFPAVPEGGPTEAIGTSVAMDAAGRPLLVGSVLRQSGDWDMGVVRFGAVAPVFRDGFE